jgi:hypothetical protein
VTVARPVPKHWAKPRQTYCAMPNIEGGRQHDHTHHQR